MAYTWGSTELKVLKDGYKPFSSSETVINEIEIIPGSTNTGEIVSSIQVGPSKRRNTRYSHNGWKTRRSSTSPARTWKR